MDMSYLGEIYNVRLLSCVWCERVLELDDHLLMRCGFVRRIKDKIFKWLGVEIVLPGILPLLDIFTFLGVQNRINPIKKS